MTSAEFVYTTYIKSTPQKVWDAITNPEFTRQYWGGYENISEWKKGAKWHHVSSDKEGKVRMQGEILESVPPKRLVLTWASPDEPGDKSRVTFEIEQAEDMVRLNVIHDELKPGSEMRRGIGMGWPLVLSSMKSFLETGKPINIWAWKTGCGVSETKQQVA